MEKARLIKKLYLAHIAHLLLNLVTVQIGQLLESDKVEIIENSQECEEMEIMIMENNQEAEFWHNH